MAKTLISTITNAEKSSKGVVSLGNQPNRINAYGLGNLSPSDLKTKLDSLTNCAIDKLNDIITKINGESASGAYIGITGLGDTITSLADLITAIKNGTLADLYLSAKGADGTTVDELQDIIDDIYATFNSYVSLNPQSGLTSTQMAQARTNIDAEVSGTAVSVMTTHNVSNVAHGSLFAEKLSKNTAITGGTNTKITYDSNGLVTGGADLVASDIPDLSDTYIHKNASITGATKAKITYDENGLVTGGADLILTDIPDISPLYLATGRRGVANGVAGLDSNGKVPLSQINDGIVGNVTYIGVWNASNGTATSELRETTGGLVLRDYRKGDYYITGNAGYATPTGTGSIRYELGDWIIYTGIIDSGWDKIDNTDAVSSVNSKVGNVTLTLADLNGDTTHRVVTDTEKAEWNGKSNFSGNYNDLTNKPTIPTNSSFTLNGLSEKSYNSLTDKPTIPTNSSFTLSGLGEKSYNNLTDKPTIPTVTNDLTNALKGNYDSAYLHSQSSHAPSNAEANVQSDWSQTINTADDFIKNKPTIPTIDQTYGATSVNAQSGVAVAQAIAAAITATLNTVV